MNKLMSMNNSEQLTSVAIIGGGINACLMALLIKERLNGVVGEIQFMLDEGADSELGLIPLSAGARWLHKLLGLDEKILLRRGIATYLYGSKLAAATTAPQQVVGEDLFLSHEIVNLPHLAGPWFELIHHARSKNHNLKLDSFSLGALASREGRFLDSEVIKGPYSNLSVNLLVDAKAYKHYLLEQLLSQHVTFVTCEPAQLCHQSDKVFIRLEDDHKLEPDLVIDFTSNDNKDYLPDSIKQYKDRIVSGRVDSYLWSSFHTQSGGLACPVLESFPSASYVYSKMEYGCLRQDLCLGEYDGVEEYAQRHSSFAKGVLNKRHVNISMCAPFWLDNYICFPAADYTPWDPCWSMWDLVREGMINLIEYWPDVESMSGFADEFNRLNHLVAKDHFELAAVFCEARGWRQYFSREMHLLAQKRIELYETYGVIQDAEYKFFSTEYWAKVMIGCGLRVEKPVGLYSEAAVTDFIKQVDVYRKELSISALRMPNYNEYVNYLLR